MPDTNVDTDVEDIPAENLSPEGDDLSEFLILEEETTDDAPDDAPDDESDDESDEDTEDAADDEPDDAAGEEEETEEEPLFAVWDDDGKVKMVPEAEAKAQVMRQRDYTRKTMETAERRKAADAELEAAKAEREEYKASLVQWAVQQSQEPDWAQLAETLLPQQFNLARAQWEQQIKKSEAAKNEYHRLMAQEKEAQEAERQQKAYEAVERLYAEFPEWRDPEVGKKAMQELVATAKEYGYDDDEITNLSDDRQVRILRDASLYRQMVAKNTATIDKRVSNPGKTLRPGGKVTAKQKSARSEKQHIDRMKKTNGDADTFTAWLTS